MNKIVKNYLLALMILAASFVFVPKDAEAVFLLLQEISAESVGQANMLTAYGQRPSSQYQNSSNISFIDEDLSLEAAFTLYLPVAKYTSPQGESVNAEVAAEYAPHFYAAYRPLEWLAFGLAAFPNYGIITKWPDGWEGSYVAIKNNVKTFTLNPNVSFGPFKGFAISAGFSATWSYINTTRMFTLGMLPDGDDATSKMQMIGRGWCFGGNAGVSYQPVDWVRMGLSYRSAFTLKFDGGMDFDVADPWAWRFNDQDFKLRINAPHQVAFGTRFWPLENLSVEVDAWYFSWSTHKSRDVEMEEGVYIAPDEKMMIDSAPQNLTDGFLIGVGAEYWFVENFAARMGLSYSSNVQPDEAVDPVQPDGQRVNVAAGFGYGWKGIHVDLAYMLGYIIPHEVGLKSAMPGKYENLKHVVSFSIGYQFDVMGDNKEDAVTKE